MRRSCPSFLSLFYKLHYQEMFVRSTCSILGRLLPPRPAGKNEQRAPSRCVAPKQGVADARICDIFRACYTESIICHFHRSSNFHHNVGDSFEHFLHIHISQNKAKSKAKQKSLNRLPSIV